MLPYFYQSLIKHMWRRIALCLVMVKDLSLSKAEVPQFIFCLYLPEDAERLCPNPGLPTNALLGPWQKPALKLFTTVISSAL